MTGVSNSVYSKRKRFLPEYRKLFAALLDIPDEDVRDRVMNAVNGFQTCSVCRIKIDNLKNVATQTEDTGNVTNNMEIHENTEDIAPNSPVVAKRRRKRKRNCPKVVKTAQHSSTTPVLTQDNVPPKLDIELAPAKIMRTDSEDIYVNDILESCPLEKTLESINLVQNDENIERIKEKMKEEWDTCQETNSAGLLPIHVAITQNNVAKLKRQIYVWKFRQFDLMQLFTDEGDDLIQLAVKENCYKYIIEELLNEKSIHLNNIDDDCNSIIHLAITHLVDDPDQQESLKSFELLLNKIDIKLLMQRNNEGLTALHLAVKEDKFLMAEKILNVIDDRLKLKSVPRLDKARVDKDIFQQHYCKQCDCFEGREQDELKNNILNAKDMKRGCTALYFAMELKHDHMVYLLMAHMCNPLIKNLSGLDAKSYYTDHGNNASIVGALDKLAEFQYAVPPQDSSKAKNCKPLICYGDAISR